VEIYEIFPSQNSRMSSTKRRCAREKEELILIHLIFVVEDSLWIILLIHSTTRRKRSGERGHPWWSPLSSLKNFVVDPFMRRAKDVDEIQFIIQVTKG
jgi:hypothetical protein